MKKYNLHGFYVLILFFIISCNRDNDKKRSNSGNSIIIKKADSLFNLGKSYSQDSLIQDKALILYSEALNLFKKNNDKYKEARVYQYKGYAYDYKASYDSVIIFHKKAAKLFSELDKKRLRAVAYNNIAIAFTISGNLDSALYYYNKALKITEITRDTLEFIELYQNMGISYSYAGDNEKAVEYTVKALKYAEKSNYANSILSLNLHIAQYYNETKETGKAFEYLKCASEYADKADNKEAKASFYNTFGEYYLKNNKYTEAKKNFLKTLEISKKINYKRGIAAAYENLALLFLQKKDYINAEKFADLSLKTEENINNASGIISSLIMLAEIYYKSGKESDAALLLKKAEKICKEKNLLEHLPDIYFHYGQIYKRKNKYKTALIYIEKYYSLKDSMSNVDLKEKISDMEIKYQSEKKQHKIELLNEENKTKEQELKKQNLLIVLLALVLVIIIGIAYFLKQQAKHKLNKIESQIQQYILQIKDLNTQKKNGQKINLREVSDKYKLTERETEILCLIGEGKSNSEIANKIFVSSNTVKYHIKNIYLKLDVKNRVEARNKIIE